MRRFLLLAAIAFLSIIPANAGDLGFSDQFLSGVRAKSERYNQREFDDYGNKIIFTPERLEIILSERLVKWLGEKRFGNIDYEAALAEAYIKPDQVISYDYHVQHGTGIAFKIFYKARNGDKALATMVFRDENTAKSFHNTFLL